MKRYATRPQYLSYPVKPLTQRHCLALRLREEEGKDLLEIGNVFGFTKSAALRLVGEARAMRRKNARHAGFVDRNHLVVELREVDRQPYSKIGAALGLSRQRAEQLYRHAKNLARYHAAGKKGDALYGLSTRAAKVCKRMGLSHRAGVEDAIKSGWLRPRAFKSYGIRTHQEIREWLDKSYPEKSE